jgi:type I restriction enzyme S subunit
MRQWKRYPKYKDSGVEWLGEIPEGWGVKRIKLASPIINEKIDLVNQNFQYIALENIESWTGRFKESNSEIQPESLVNIFCKNNVLFGKLRPYLAKVYHTSNNGVCSSEFFVLKPKDITPNYLFEYLLNREFIDIINSSTYGAKMPRANWDFFGDQLISIPPLPEQTAIASFLDRKTARIDILIEKKQRQIELLQEKRAALISQAVTKGLDPTVPMKDSGVPWLGEVPEHWEINPLKLISSIIPGQSPHESTYNLDGTGAILINGPAEYSEDDFGQTRALKWTTDPKKWAPKNCLLFCLRGSTTGRLNISHSKVSIGRGVAAIVAKESQQYINNCFISARNYLLGTANGSTFPSITSELLENLQFPLPPEKEQVDICNYLFKQKEIIDSINLKLNLSIETLKKYRSALISAAVTGKIDVRETIPTHQEAQS